MVAAVLAVALVGAGCGSDESGDDSTTEPPPVEDDDTGDEDEAAAEEPVDHGSLTVAMSVPQSVLFLPADLGPSTGAFEECGVDVEIITGDAGTVNQSLAAGEADMILHLGGLAVGGIMQGIEGKVVAGQINPWIQVLVVSNELGGSISTLEDLDSVASEDQLSFGITAFGSGSHLSILKLAEELGWTEGEQYDIVSLGGVSEITAALEADQIDGFAWSPEVAYTMQARGVATVVEDIVADTVGPNVFEAFIASNEVIEQRPEALKAYFECYFALVQEFKEDPEQVRTLALEEWDKDAEALDLTYEFIVDSWNEDGTATPEELEGLAEATVFQNDAVDEAPVEDWWLYWGDL